MMELERRRTHRVSTVDAAASRTGNELGLATLTTALLRSIRLRVSLASPVFAELCNVEDRDWRLRRVMRAEWGAFEAETPSVQKSHFPADDLFSREGLPARMADLLLRVARRYETRAPPRSEWQALQTLLSPVKVALLAVDQHMVRKRFAACHTHQDHHRTIVLSDLGCKPLGKEDARARSHKQIGCVADVS